MELCLIYADTYGGYHLYELSMKNEPAKKFWLTTDTHFGHDKMVQYCGRPENHSELILENLKKAIGENDVLIHLGDVCIGNDEKWHTELANALPAGVKRVLILGNHDCKSTSWYLKHGWDFVCDSFSMTFLGKKLLFSHYPNKSGDHELNIHGHFHNALVRLLKEEWVIEGEKERNQKDLSNRDERSRLLALEETGYKPVLLEHFINS